MPKITLLAENLYLIRSTQTFVDGHVNVWYYETPSVWNKSPLRATLFQDYENGEGHLNMYHERDKGKGAWFDGRKEVLEVVPMYGELINSPNGKVIEIKKG